MGTALQAELTVNSPKRQRLIVRIPYPLCHIGNRSMADKPAIFRGLYSGRGRGLRCESTLGLRARPLLLRGLLEIISL
jgi:hypothetical protein